MKNKIFLSSMLIMSVAPAMAETFPTGGLMQENKTYDNAATETNMDGVYEGTVNANAEYETINYLLNAGQYLPADSETVTPCTAGSFCAGGTTVQYNQTTPQGIQTCPSGFGSSADGSSSNTQCYRACDVNNMGTNGSISSIAHATAISGNDYYGAGTDTCEPTACEHGWHVKAAVPDLTTAIGTDAGASYGYVNNAGEQQQQATTLGISDNNTWAVDYGTNGMLIGQGRCSTQAGTNNNYTWTDPTITANLADETGKTGAKYCYCNVTGYTPNGGTLQAVLSPWVFEIDFEYDYGFASGCTGLCAFECARRIRDTSSSTLAFRAALLGSVQSSPAMCEANVININWSDASAADISANNAGTATYGSDVRTPVKATTKKGKTFKGWRFSKPEQTNL